MVDDTLNKHQYISFTAHYTSYIWYTLGLSHQQLITPLGRTLGLALAPVEYTAERWLGSSMRATLIQRHRLIDEQLQQFLMHHPNAQVVELASGLSPRGWSFSQQFPDIRYIEVDLPKMAQLKRQLLDTLQARVEVVSCNIFDASFDALLASLDNQRPLVVISEGLINYFSLTLIEQLFRKLSAALPRHEQYVYITDLYPKPVRHRFARLIDRSSKLLKYLSRSEFSFYFSSPTELRQFAMQCGFENVVVYQPSHLQVAPAATEEHFGDLVWVLTLK